MRSQGALSADEVAIRSVPINGEIYQLTQLIRGSRIQPTSYDQSSMWLSRYRVLRLAKSLPSPEAKIGSAMQLLSKKKDLLTFCVSLFVGCMIGHMFDT